MAAIGGDAVLPVELCAAAAFRIEYMPKSPDVMPTNANSSRCDAQEYCIKTLILRVALKELDPSVQDCGAHHDVASEGEVCADLGKLGA